MPNEKKKLLILAVLEILRRQTDEDHRMRQAEIIERLGEGYGLTATRKSVRQNLADLVDAGYPILFNKGWYYRHEFRPEELNFLTDCVLGSSIPQTQRTALVKRIAALGGEWYTASADAGEAKPANPQFLQSIDVLHRAIDEGRQVSFRYGNYDVDKELHPRLDASGKPKLYRVTPFRVIIANGRSYLVCNVERHDGLCHFRVDRIIDVKQLKQAGVPMSKVTGAEEPLEAETYTAEHPYMYSGPAGRYRLRVARSLINDVLDWFGLNVAFENTTDGETEAVVTSDQASMDIWLRRYGDRAVLLGPEAH